MPPLASPPAPLPGAQRTSSGQVPSWWGRVGLDQPGAWAVVWPRKRGSEVLMPENPRLADCALIRLHANLLRFTKPANEFHQSSRIPGHGFSLRFSYLVTRRILWIHLCPAAEFTRETPAPYCQNMNRGNRTNDERRAGRKDKCRGRSPKCEVESGARKPAEDACHPVAVPVFATTPRR